jgi:hypothetical protein
MTEQRPDVRKTVPDKAAWKKDSAGRPIHEGLEKAIEAFQAQYKPGGVAMGVQKG